MMVYSEGDWAAERRDIMSADDRDLTLLDEQAEARVRRVWHEGRWFFSVIDVIGLLTDSAMPRRYWTDMKGRLQDKGSVGLSAKMRAGENAVPGWQTAAHGCSGHRNDAAHHPGHSVAQSRAVQAMAGAPSAFSVAPHHYGCSGVAVAVEPPVSR